MATIQTPANVHFAANGYKLLASQVAASILATLPEPAVGADTHSLKEQISFQKAQIAELVANYPDAFYWKQGALPKPAREIVNIMKAANARNSNFLLNVGPDKRGRFEKSSVKVLAEIGQLMAPASGE